MKRTRLMLKQLVESWPSDSRVVGPRKESVSVWKIVTLLLYLCAYIKCHILF